MTTEVITPKNPTWSHLGTDVTTAMNSAQALQAGGLDFDVRLVQIPKFYESSGRSVVVTDKRIVVRDQPESDRETIYLGTVGRIYTPVQNRESFQFCDDLMDVSKEYETEGYHYYTAAMIGDGRRVFITMKAPTYMTLMNGDAIDGYVVLSTSHDGSRSFTALTTPVHERTGATLTATMKGAHSAWSVRHTPNVASRMGEAQRALNMVANYMELFERRANELLTKKITRGDVEVILNKIYPDADSKVGQTKADNARSAVKGVYAGDKNASSTGTAFGLYTAISTYYDFDREWGKNSVQKRAEGALFGNGLTQKDKALKIIEASV